MSGRSMIWYHFTKLEKKAKCRYCQGMIAMSSGSTGNLKRHLKTKHPMISLEREEQNEGRSRSPLHERPVNNPSETSPPSGSGTAIPIPSTSTKTLSVSASNAQQTSPMPSIPLGSTMSRSSHPQSSMTMTKFVDVVRPIPACRKRMIDTQLLKMICKEYRPFSIVEDEEFRKFIHLLNPNYTLPSRKTMSTSLLPVVHDEILLKVKKDIEGAEAICLTCDGWTNINNTSFYAITAHYFDKATRLKSCLLECSEFSESHTSTNISAWIRQVLIKFSINHKICAIVTDNAANMKAAAADLDIRHIPCYAHSLNLVVRDAIECSITEVVDKAKAIVQFFKQSSSALAKLHEMQTSLNKKHLKLKQDIITRWSSTYDMLVRLLENKDPIVSTLALLGSKDNLLLQEQEWVAVKHIVHILSVFNSVTEEISSEANVSLSKTTILARIMARKVNQYLDSHKDIPENVIKLGTELLKNLAKRFGNREDSELVAQCIILDPRFKAQGFGEESKFKAASKMLINKLKYDIDKRKEEYSEDATPSTTKKNKESSCSVWNEFDEALSSLQAKHDPHAEAIVQLDKYLNEPYLPRVNDPLEWWENRKFTYPNLYSIMRKRLCILSTSTPCERLFSKAGQVCTERRSRLTSQKIKMMLFIGQNMHLV